MRKEELRKNGTKLCERDMYNNGFYASTNCYYLLDDCIYCISDNVDNGLNYNGVNRTNFITENVEERLKTMSDDYWCVGVGLTVDGYHKLCEMHSVEPSTKCGI